MFRNTCHWMACSILSLALFSGETSAATAPCKGCNGYKGVEFSPQVSYNPRGAYLSIFGGGGSITNTHASQRGTAFFPETSVGPLAVDASANVNSHNTWFAGANLGYAWRDKWCITPAVEFEGFYLRNTLNGTLDAPHTALPEHTFDDSFPFRSTVFLINTVLKTNVFSPQTQLYLGGGIGGAILSISGADSLQVNPPELGVNHFSAETSAQTSTFAAQLKAGVSYAFTDCISIFAEYRLLYLGPSEFTFGSTVAPGHVPTSPWTANFDGMFYNLGAAGIQFSF